RRIFSTSCRGTHQPMIDPICGMQVDPERAAASYAYNGQNYYFCSQHCLAKFKQDPVSFLKSSAGERGTAHAVMHEGASAGNASKDPVCGMKVDPTKAAGTHEFNG